MHTIHAKMLQNLVALALQGGSEAQLPVVPQPQEGIQGMSSQSSDQLESVSLNFQETLFPCLVGFLRP